MKRVLIALLVLVCCVSGVFAEGAAETQSYPSKDINVYIFSSQGGGTDTWTRFLAPLMEKELGVNIICNNLPGANGGNGAQKVWNAPHDGYSVLGASETSMFFGSNDVAPTSENWKFYIAGGSAGVIAVPADSPYQTIEDLVAAAKANPGSVSIANSGQGKGWHIKAVATENAAGCEFKHVPYNGSGPAITAVLSGETAALSCSTGEITEYVRSGMMRPLVITESYSVDFPDYDVAVPNCADLYPESAFYFANFFQWLGFMLPADCPQEVLDKFEAAFVKVLQDPAVAEFAAAQPAELFGLVGEEASELAKNMETVSWWMAQDLGIAKIDPASKGIERP